MTKSELKSIIKECIEEISIDEAFGNNKKSQLPEELKINAEDLIKGRPFINKMHNVIKFYEDNGYDKKEIGRQVSGLYYGIVGSAFHDKNQLDAPYVPKLYAYADILNRYPLNKNAIVKDLNNSLKLEGKANVPEDEKERFLKVQKAYLDDVKKALAKLQ